MLARRQVPVPLPAGCLAELRRWARSFLREHRVVADVDDVLVVLTELVTNSVRHGAGPVEVSLVQRPDGLGLAVSDASDELPSPPRGDAVREGGRGIALLDGMTMRWRVRLDPGTGKTVWCEFAAPPT